MNAIKRDLNFFTAYKKGSPKAGNSGAKGVILVMMCFVLVVGIAWGVLFFVQRNIKNQISTIKTELSRPAVIKLQDELNQAAKKNELMSSYRTAITLAKKSFDASRVIDSSLFGKITESMPQDMTIKSFVVNPQSIQMLCSCTDKMSPAVLKQALEKKAVFSNITYDGVTLNEEKGTYSFTMNCIFGVDKKDE
jgi:hypothetical protein